MAYEFDLKASTLKTIHLEGRSPWGFRIIELNQTINKLTINDGLSTQLVVSKVRSKSKAHLAGLKENDLIILINDISTNKLSLHAASDLIESCVNLRLVVCSSNQNIGLEESESSEKSFKLDMHRATGANSTELSNVGRNSKILYANPAFTKFIAPSTTTSLKSNNFNTNCSKKEGFSNNNYSRFNDSKTNLSLRDSNHSISNYYDNPNSSSKLHNSISNQSSANQKLRNSSLKLRNYYSATESNGEDEFESNKIKTSYLNSRFTKNYNNNCNNKQSSNVNEENKNRVSYASITLRQPLKDFNYFSDTEAFSNTAPKFKLKNLPSLTNQNSFRTTLNNANNNLKQNQHQQIEQIEQLHRRSNSQSFNQQSLLLPHQNTNKNNYNQIHKQTEPDYLVARKNLNSFDCSNQLNIQDLSSNTSNNNNNNNNFNCNQNKSILTTVQNLNRMYTQTNFNRQPHGFSKLGGFGTNPQPSEYNPNTPSYKWTPSTQQYQLNQELQQALPRRDSVREEQVDPVLERYEREMGSELAKPTNDSNYSDSYFYNSTVHNYPTINDQKKLAKTIADTLEGSNPATSKYHKKKQNIQTQMNKDGYESEPPFAGSYNTHINQVSREEPPMRIQNSFLYDDSLPDMIKRSIAQASMNDPVRMVQAPENFKQQHYVEHTTHTQMPPKEAMSLAAALESDQMRGGRGAQIFQKRKAKSEKWVIDESNVKKLPGQFYQAPVPVPQPEMFEPRQQIDEHKLEQYSNQQNNFNFNNFNNKPRGWGERGNGSVSESLIKPVKLDTSQDAFQRDETPLSVNTMVNAPLIEHNPNKIDLSAWNNQKYAQQQQQQTSQFSVSKDGVQNLKARFYEAAVSKPIVGYSSVQPSLSSNKIRVNKVSSHENYLFNNKNAQNVLNNPVVNYQQQDYHNKSNSFDFYSNCDDEIAASDL